MSRLTGWVGSWRSGKGGTCFACDADSKQGACPGEGRLMDQPHSGIVDRGAPLR
jgi:hypothetical protein